MKFKPGDRVVFLNEKGGGVVTQVVSDKVVKVAIEDGFEIPYAITELLNVSGSNVTGSNLTEAASQKEESNPDMLPLYSIPDKVGQPKPGAYLAMIPSNQDKPLEGMLEFWIVNHSDYEMLFALYLNRSGSFHGTEYGFIKANSALYIQDVGRQDLEHWKNGLLQKVYFGAGKSKPMKPTSSPIEFKPVRTYQEENFLFDGLLKKKAIMVPLGNLSELHDETAINPLPEENLKLLQEKLHQGSSTPLPEKKISSFLDKHKVDDKIAEVDLHISELVETTYGMSNTDMLKIQMDYLKKCIDQSQVEKISKLIFIHGVGNGVLKSELHKYLRGIEGVQFYDASYARYGRGATELVFYRNS